MPIKRNWILYIILLCIFLPYIFFPILQAPDTNSYITFSSTRPPLFPLLLWLNRLFVGNNYRLLQIFYLSLTFGAFFYLDYWLRKNYSVPRTVTIFFLLLFMVPMYIIFPYGHYLLSECIAFPLFIFTFIFLSDFFIRRNVSSAIKFSIMSALLILTRAQFYFIYGFFIFSIIWMFIYKDNCRHIITISFVFFISIVLINVLNHSYHYVVNRHFSDSSAVGAQLLTQAVFLSNMNDKRYFREKKEKDIFTQIITNGDEKGLILHSQVKKLSSSRVMGKYYQYEKNYNPLLDNNVAVLYSFGVKNDYEVNEIATKMAAILYRYNFRQNLKFFLLKIYVGLGRFPGVLIFVLFTTMLLGSLYKNKHNKITIQGLVGLFFCLANIVMVAVFVPVLDRILIYSYFSIGISVVVLLNRYYVLQFMG